MPTFPRKPFPTAASQSTLPAFYRRHLKKHPFALFGLPFIVVMVAGSFVLTPATAIRYEHHDLKTQRLSREDELKLALGDKKRARKVDMKEEYYRLMAKDIDNWEQRRVPRFEGEVDGILVSGGGEGKGKG